MDTHEAWLHLRNTLADPPGLANSTKSRRHGLYVSCILQFEQLTSAAAAVASHARPLPLYYAAMHAAKALIAACGEQEHPRGHGLRQPRGDLPDEVLAFEVEPHPKDPGVLSDLCAITKSGRPTGRIALSDLYLALPDLAEKPHSLSGQPALFVERVPDPTEYTPIPDPFLHVVVEATDLPADPEEIQKTFPSLTGWEREDPHQTALTSRAQLGMLFRRDVPYRERHIALDRLAPTYRFTGTRWLIPTVSGGTGVFSPLVTWYCLLFGFSILARYEPDTWVNALNVRRANAVAIEAALDEAIRALPELVWKHIATTAAEQRLSGEAAGPNTP